MSKEELLKSIENGESVWCYYVNEKEVEELQIPTHRYKIENDELIIQNDWYYPLKYLFKSKAEAEHYLHHANITRIETLPFLTWEEFDKQEDIKFTGKDKKEYSLFIDCNQVKIFNKSDFKYIFREDANEENFYKAYDECVKLFKGEEE